MRKTIGLIMTLAFLISIPVMASATSYTMTDNNSFATVDSSSDRGMHTWSVDGQDHLYRQWFWYRVGDSGPENALNTLTLDASRSGVYGLNNATNNLDLVYTANDFEIAITFALRGGSAGSHASDIAESITINNTSNTALDFHFFQYSDFDLGGDSSDDYANAINANTIDQWDLQTVLAETAVAPAPNHWEVARYSDLLNRLRDGAATTLADVAAATPGDMTWGFQWDRTIAAGGTFQISKDKNIAPVPEPATLFLLGSSMIGFAVNKRKKNKELS